MRSTAALRAAWNEWACNTDRMTRTAFGPARVHVAAFTRELWAVLAAVMERHNYSIRPADTWGYNCRAITGGSELSLHAFGIALDVNATTNPYVRTPDGRQVRFSRRRSQRARADDVRAGRADTDMTRKMIADIRAIQTAEGRAVFAWGGDFQSVKDAMHFQIDLTPDELRAGLAQLVAEGPATTARNFQRSRS